MSVFMRHLVLNMLKVTLSGRFSCNNRQDFVGRIPYCFVFKGSQELTWPLSLLEVRLVNKPTVVSVNLQVPLEVTFLGNDPVWPYYTFPFQALWPRFRPCRVSVEVPTFMDANVCDPRGPVCSGTVTKKAWDETFPSQPKPCSELNALMA